MADFAGRKKKDKKHRKGTSNYIYPFSFFFMIILLLFYSNETHENVVLIIVGSNIVFYNNLEI